MDVKTLCLGVLTEGNKSGYEIKRCFEEAFSHFFVAGFGSIYPALAELSRAGLVTCENVEQEGRPDKKVYSLTPAGERSADRRAVDHAAPAQGALRVPGPDVFRAPAATDAAGRDHRREDRAMGTGGGRNRSLLRVGRCACESGHAVCRGLRAGRDRRGVGIRAGEQGRAWSRRWRPPSTLSVWCWRPTENVPEELASDRRRPDLARSAGRRVVE